jgi:mRNA interferase MazF
MVIVIPRTAAIKMANFKYTYTILPDGRNGLKGISLALVCQLRAISKNRFVHNIGSLSKEDSESIDALPWDMLGLR